MSAPSVSNCRNCSYRHCSAGYSTQISPSDSGCGLKTSTPSRFTRPGGSGCGVSIASRTGSSKFSDTTTNTVATGFAPCSFQAIACACCEISTERACGQSRYAST